MDAGHKDIILNTMEEGVVFPLSTMPGEKVGHVYAGPMERETQHFLEAVAYDRPVMVQPRQARVTMEVYMAADVSAERNQGSNCRSKKQTSCRRWRKPDSDPDTGDLDTGGYQPPKSRQRVPPGHHRHLVVAETCGGENGERVPLSHVERVVGPEEDAICAEPSHQRRNQPGSKTVVSNHT